MENNKIKSFFIPCTISCFIYMCLYLKKILAKNDLCKRTTFKKDNVTFVFEIIFDMSLSKLPLTEKFVLNLLTDDDSKNQMTLASK